MTPLRMTQLTLRILAQYLLLAVMQGTLAYATGVPTMPLTLQSPDFTHQGAMPPQLTCDADNISPSLHWSTLPTKTKSVVLIVDDPDAPDPAAPKMTWVHWLLYNIPITVTELPQGVAAEQLPPGILQGKNDWQKLGYGGPCPPIGRHRYFHKLYALDIELPDLKHPTKAQLEQAMRGHVLEEAQLMGTYQRHSK